jgi:SynChlorMet cassette protein ScmC
MRAISAEEDRYLLQLADGQGWDIVAAQGVRSWASTFASIMQLDPHASNRHPKLIFTRKRGGMAGWEELPPTGWKPQDLTSLQVWYHPEVSDVVCELGHAMDDTLEIIRMWLALSPVYNRTLESGGLPLHAAMVAKDGKGILIAAAGGIGKSTCCRRILPPWEALCDDTTLVVLDGQNRFRAHPFPTWSNYLWKRAETTWDVQQHVPLAAILFLEQGPADEVITVGKGQASVLITEAATQVCQTGWRNILPQEQRIIKEAIFENACTIARRVPAFRLRATMHGRFWEEMEHALQQIL